ncbi:hypothetical protein TNCV_178131 [Trichonephila clavipes]|nr:hypothetical protein TNCV_178131 [Trichonephila clavipes]
MLDEGIVQPSESPWSSPIVLEAGLKLNSKRSAFCCPRSKDSGHLVSSNGVRPDPDKIKADTHFWFREKLMTDAADIYSAECGLEMSFGMSCIVGVPKEKVRSSTTTRRLAPSLQLRVVSFTIELDPPWEISKVCSWKNKWIIVRTDYSTRYAITKPCRQPKSTK